MNSIITRRALSLGALSGALALPAIRKAHAQSTLEWVAGSVGGGWYTMAAGLSSLIAEENPDIRIRVTPGGGLANPTRIQNGQAQMGWGIDAFTASAGRGEEPYTAKHDKLRSLGTGYSPTEHHFLRADGTPVADMRTILTTKGVKIGAPQRSSTDEMTLQRILKFLGSSPDKIRADGGRYLTGSYADISAAYSDGQVDYLYAALAKPAAIFTEIAQGRRGGQLVDFPADIRKHLIDTYAYAEGIIPAGTYPTLQKADVPVTTMDSVILLNESVPEDVAYKIMKTLIKNKGQRLASIHVSMAAWDPAVSWKYPGVPLAPGAAKAYKEAGLMPA
ncbi:TAXI family TRAP transporter solute-binding subunit [Acetobacteraceae bacterium H6797]|nr:TAXI family TRAP transporter solute-binding subunit [Acetobacteraceae bacterium H6797]